MNAHLLQAEYPILGAVATRRSRARVMWSEPDLPAALANVLWSDPASLAGGGEVLRESGARRTTRIAWEGRHLIVKHYVESTFWRASKQLVRPSRAAATWWITLRLMDSGVATPRPLAFVENRWGPLRRDSYLVYEYVEGGTLRQYLTGDFTEEMPSVEQVCRRCAAMWNRLAEARISLSDPNLGNFIVSKDGVLWIIDLDKSRHHAHAADASKGLRRSWDLFVGSARKTGADAVRFVSEVWAYRANAEELGKTSPIRQANSVNPISYSPERG